MRYPHRLIAIICLLAIPSFTFAQLRISTGVEAGVAATGLLKNVETSTNSRGEVFKNTNSYTLKPAVGGWAKLQYRKHLFVAINGQYYAAGSRFTRHIEGKKWPDEDYTVNDVRTMQRHKISLPITIGYDFRIWKIRANVFAGYKKDYNFSGSYKETHTYTSLYENSTETSIDEDPFDKTHSRPAQRWTSGLIAGMGVYITPRASINVSCDTKQEIYFSQSTGGWESRSYVGITRDILFTLRYSIVK